MHDDVPLMGHLEEVAPFEFDDETTVELVEVGRGLEFVKVALLAAIAVGVGILVARDRG